MYPNLRKLLELIGYDSGMNLKQDLEWPPGVEHLESMASRLRADGVDDLSSYQGEYEYKDEFEILAMGEADDILRLVNKKKLNALDDFLAECFDGEWHRKVFK